MSATSPGSGAVAAGSRIAPAAAQVRSSDPASTTELLLAAVVLAVLAMAYNFALGRDLNWDYFNYHAYAALSLRQDRMAQDFFAASLQGYLNPLPFIPFAWMQALGWHSLAIASGLAILHSFNASLLYAICRRFTGDTTRPRTLAATLTACGIASGAFLAQVGSTFVDPVITPLVMLALLLLMCSPSAAAPLVAGALAGAAAGLKLTNLPFALAILVAAAFSSREAGATWRPAWRPTWTAAAGMAMGFGLVAAGWAWRLAQEFGSPVFPLFNRIFQSPEFPLHNFQVDRFIPQTLLQALELPVRLASHEAWVYFEGQAPDIRPAMLMAAGLCWLPLAVVRMLRGTSGRGAEARPRDPEAAVVMVFFAVALLAWILTSGNGRYATPLILLTSPMLFIAFRGLAGMRIAAMACLVATLLQGFQIVDIGSPRWSPNDWTRSWLPATVPAELRTRPHLFVSVGTSSESFVAAFVHPGSRFVNPIGQASIATDGPGWPRFVRLRDAHVGNTQVLLHVPELAGPERIEKLLDTLDDAIERLGLQLADRRCHRLVFNDEADPIPYLAGRGNKPDPRRVLLSCPAVPRTQASAELTRRRQLAGRIVDAFESRCPRLFAPGGQPIEGSAQRWTRLYAKFDLFVTVSLDTDQVFYQMQRQGSSVLIGHVSSWQADAAAFTCRLPHGGLRDASTLDPNANR